MKRYFAKPSDKHIVWEYDTVTKQAQWRYNTDGRFSSRSSHNLDSIVTRLHAYEISPPNWDHDMLKLLVVQEGL